MKEELTKEQMNALIALMYEFCKDKIKTSIATKEKLKKFCDEQQIAGGFDEAILILLKNYYEQK